jgi:hypothetical protein
MSNWLTAIWLSLMPVPATYVTDVEVMRQAQKECLDARGTFKIMQAQGGWAVKCSTINLTHERSKAR